MWKLRILPVKLTGFLRFEVFTAVRMMMFWVLAPCRLVGRYQRFGETHCPHLQAWVWLSEMLVHTASQSRTSTKLWSDRSLKRYSHSCYNAHPRVLKKPTGKEKSWVSRCNKQEVAFSVITALRKEIKPHMWPVIFYFRAETDVMFRSINSYQSSWARYCVLWMWFVLRQ
jgi:hypothetical protein